ncbi:MAG: Cof-type HAD-IIB family hydrolase [Erysipelotrichaceae bacterium]|nr:Cof-type HAD-IIB family hydrolase [Erysipelotrichaceae bacterium]
MIKVCFFDIDGTLLSHKTGQVPASTTRALRQLREKGIKTVISTGRSLEEMLKLPILEVPFDAYLTLNGQLCLDENYQMFAGTPIEEGDMEILISMFEAKRIPLVLIREDGRAINFVNDTVIHTQNSTHGTIPEVDSYNGEKIYQVLGFIPEKEKNLLKQTLDECDITSWNDTGIDIIAKGGGKDVGMQRYMDKEGFRKAETMAFGDGENDIPMLQFAGIGVAMGNAKDMVKEKADYVTTDIDDNGIENALRHFGLIEGNTDLTIDRQEDDKNVTLNLSGPVNTSTADILSRACEEIQADGREVNLNCDDVHYISSTGLRIILALSKKIGSDKLHVLNVSEDVEQIFEMTGFVDIMDIQKK